MGSSVLAVGAASHATHVKTLVDRRGDFPRWGTARFEAHLSNCSNALRSRAHERDGASLWLLQMGEEKRSEARWIAGQTKRGRHCFWTVARRTKPPNEVG